MAVMAAVSLLASSDPNFAALAARYDSDDDTDIEDQPLSTAAQPELQERLKQQGVVSHQQPAAGTAAAAGTAVAVNGYGAGAAAETDANGDFEQYYEEQGPDEEDSDEEGDDDELYAALEWADSREGEQWRSNCT